MYDKFGCSIADCLLRTDMGAVVRGTDVYVAGVWVPGVASRLTRCPGLSVGWDSSCCCNPGRGSQGENRQTEELGFSDLPPLH